MKKNLTICFLSGILAGCGATQSPISITQKTPTPPQSTNPFDGVSFPQESCGDNLPDDPQIYPIEFYPIYIDYSDSNLQAVQSKFCRDALKRYRKILEKDSIQVASFTSKERANHFKNLMHQEFGSGEVGEPNTIQKLEFPGINHKKPIVAAQPEFDITSFPKEYCGDELPQDANAYPLEFYPVYFSEKNRGDFFKLIYPNFCRRDIISNINRGNLLGYFTGKERANQFKKIIETKTSNVKIGEPIVFSEKPLSLEEVAKAAKLNSENVEKLMHLSKNSLMKNTAKDEKIIVPTYIPEGFKVNIMEIEVLSDKRQVSRQSSESYYIEYRNASNHCFDISGTLGGGFGAGPRKTEKIEVLSRVLGKVTIEYTEFDEIINGAMTRLVGVYPSVLYGETYKMFYHFSSYEIDGCQAISIQESVKILESLQFLNFY
jgi:serine/threonine-protein kinase